MGQYMLWADERILEIVKTLTDEEFSQELIQGAGSIRDRYLHMTQGHCQWYYRWVNKNPESVNFESLERDALFKFLNRCNGMIMDLIQGNGFDAAKVPSSTGEIYLTMEEMVFNIINHATYHRGQIVTILRCLGKEVTSSDYMSYLIDVR
ncbi:MAG: DinB family protein [Candidatus Thorarchaeota archaeon]